VKGSRATTDKEFARYLRISVRSSHEVDFHLDTMGELEMVSRDVVDQATKNNEEARKMICGLIDYLDGQGN
jgi:four helix bundle protein